MQQAGYKRNKGKTMVLLNIFKPKRKPKNERLTSDEKFLIVQNVEQKLKELKASLGVTHCVYCGRFLDLEWCLSMPINGYGSACLYGCPKDSKGMN